MADTAKGLIECANWTVDFNRRIKKARYCCCMLKTGLLYTHSTNDNVKALCISNPEKTEKRLFVRCFSPKCDRWAEMFKEDYDTMQELQKQAHEAQAEALKL